MKRQGPNLSYPMKDCGDSNFLNGLMYVCLRGSDVTCY